MSADGACGRTRIAWWTDVAPRVRRAPRCALFLDFDGTLAELTARPDDARLPDETRRVLRTLSRRPRARLVFISGRRRDDLWRRVRLPGCRYLGLFGFESAAATSLTRSAVMQHLGARAATAVAGLPDVWIEDKGVAFVVHFRDAAPDVRARARRLVRRVLGTAAPVRLLESAHGLEVVPPGVTGKGAAVRRLLRGAELRRAVPIYLGDDTSDEAGFRAARHGVTVKVGTRCPTAARYRLAGTGEVRELLELLAQALR